MTPNPMREQVIEAVARAMFKAALGADNFEKHDKPTRDYWLLKATAAITAVLDATAEPTEGMNPRAWAKAAFEALQPDDELTEMWLAEQLAEYGRAMHAALRRQMTEEKQT